MASVENITNKQRKISNLAHPLDDPSVDFFQSIAALENAADLAIDPYDCLTAWEREEPAPQPHRPALDFSFDPAFNAETKENTPNNPQDAQVSPPSACHLLGTPPAPTPVSPIGPGDFFTPIAHQAINIRTNAFDTVLLREHNNWVDALERENPHWHDEQLFEAATLRVEAKIQAITFNEVLPMLLGINSLSPSADETLTIDEAVTFLTAAIKFLADQGQPKPYDTPNYDEGDLEALVSRLVKQAITEGLYGGEYATTIVDQFPRLFAGEISASHYAGITEGELASLWTTKLADLINDNSEIDCVDDNVVLLREAFYRVEADGDDLLTDYLLAQTSDQSFRQ